MRGTAIAFSISLLSCSLFAIAHADCVAQGFLADDFPDDPAYQVLTCSSAERIVEELRKSNPDWFGSFTYNEGDVVITVAAANNDAKRLMWDDTEHWYFSEGCSGIEQGMVFTRPKLNELCCDVGPVSTLPCGVGGKTLLELPE